MSELNWIDKDLGPVDAYALAVAGGYTGTKAQWIQEIANASTNAQTAATKASDAEAYAAGTRGGTDVDSDDPAYHNNAEYYRDQAQVQKEAAQAAAQTAAAAYGTDLLADDFSTESTYAVGDYVIYSGALYRCISAVTTAGSFSTNQWSEVSVGDETKNLKSAIVQDSYNLLDRASYYDLTYVDQDELIKNNTLVNTYVDSRNYSTIYIAVVGQETIYIVNQVRLGPGFYRYCFKTNTNTTRMLFRESGGNVNYQFRVPLSLADNSWYTLTFRIVSDNASTLGGLVIDRFQLVEGKEELVYTPSGMTANDANLNGIYEQLKDTSIQQTYNLLNRVEYYDVTNILTEKLFIENRFINKATDSGNAKIYLAIAGESANIKLANSSLLTTGHKKYTFQNTVDAYRVFVRASGNTKNFDFRGLVDFEADEWYTMTFDVVSIDLSTAGGLEIKNFQIVKGKTEYIYAPYGNTAKDLILQGVYSKLEEYGLTQKIENEVIPEMFGAVGDGVTDDTTAIQAAIDSGANVVTFLDKPYLHGTLTINNKSNFTIRGGKHVLTGSDAIGFKMTGTATDITIKNTIIVGDGTTESGQSGIANDSGVIIRRVRIIDNDVSNCVLGISVNANLGGSINGALVQGNYVHTIVGTNPGQGYGIHVADGQDENIGCYICNNTIVNCERHSIYVGRGRGVVVANNHISHHRLNISEVVCRAALEISRTSDVLVIGNTFREIKDGAICITAEEHPASTYPLDSYKASNILITGNLFQVNNRYEIATIFVGYANSSAGVPENITICNNLFEDRSYIRVVYGKNVNISNNSFKTIRTMREAPWTGFEDSAYIILDNVGEAESAAGNSENYLITNNTFLESEAQSIRIKSKACQMVVGMVFENNKKIGTPNLFKLEAACANDNISVIGDDSGLSEYGSITFKPVKINGQEY